MHSSDILKDELINRTFSFVCVVSMGTSATDEGGNFVTEERSPDFCSCCVERELRSIGHWLYCCIFRIAIYRTPRSIVVFDKLIVAQLIKKIPAFYGTRRFITVFTSAHHWPLSWARWILSTPSCPISLSSILISFHLRQGLRRGLVSSLQVLWPKFCINFPSLPYVLHSLPISSSLI